MFTNFQTTTAYVQASFGDPTLPGGDGMIFMLSSTLTPKWCTYFGGASPDQIYGGSISTAYPFTLVAAGATLSNGGSFPWEGTNAINYNAGMEDGWVGRFDLRTSANILSIQDLSHNTESNFVLYPNPSEGHITIAFANQTDRPELLTVYNMVGQLVYSQKSPPINDNGQILLDLNSLGNGIYFLNLQYTNKAESKKFSIIR